MITTSSFKNKTNFIEEIGRGTQGIVEKHLFNGTEVAIKKYYENDQGDIDSSALRELNIFQKLKNCASINQALDIDIVVLPSSIELQIMMPFHQYNLSQIGEILPINQKINQLPLIMNQLFNALYNLYNIGVIHADVKPDNILVDIIDNKIKLYLADFGLAVQLPCVYSYRNIKNPLRGSPLYMAPEILCENQYYDEKVDVWSTGITILDFLTSENKTREIENIYGDIITEEYKTFITDPTDEQFIQANNQSFTAIIYRILEISKNPVFGTLYIYNKIKNGQYHNYIDVELLLNKYVISPSIISALTAMLQINPSDRIHIKDLYNGKICPTELIIPRGEMVTNVINEYYIVIYNLIKCCDNLNVSPTTCYLSIDLFERYLAKYPITTIDNSEKAKLKKLSLYAASCLVLNHKLYESIEIDYDIIVIDFKNLFSSQELLFTQFYILKKINYLLTTCDTDMFVHAIHVETSKSLKTYKFGNLMVKGAALEELKESIINRKVIYPTLLNMYKYMEREGLYPGDTFSDELVEFFER